MNGFKWLCASSSVLGVLGVTGCRLFDRAEAPTSAQVQNVFQLTDQLPSTIRRVAILPISTADSRNETDSGSAQLQPVLGSELNKSGRFEVIDVSPEQMVRWTGRRTWPPTEALPADFLQTFRTAVDADALLFTHLAAYRPYKPLLIGWNIKLVDANGGYILWAVDETFDAADPSVAKSAARQAPGAEKGWGRLGTDDAVLLSPRRFAHWTLEATFDTLPGR